MTHKTHCHLGSAYDRWSDLNINDPFTNTTKSPEKEKKMLSRAVALCLAAMLVMCVCVCFNDVPVKLCKLM